MLVELSGRAVADYLALVDYISEYSTSNALSFIEDFEQARLALREFPQMGLARDEPDRRVLHFGRWYHLEYEVYAGRLIVARVKDGRRQGD